VLDWGLAKVVGRPEGEADAPALTLDEAWAEGSGHTVQGQTLGTPAYMAPEQAAGRPDLIDRRTDVYGLGAILYEILTGRPPFTGSGTAEVLRKVREEEPVPPRQLFPDVPPALEAVCLRALAKRPADRPAAAAELAREVQGWQEFERRQAEEALRKSEALYHSLVECLPCNVFRKDLEGRFTFANQRFCDLVGLPLDRLLGKTNFDISRPDFAEKYRRDDRTVIETGAVLEDIEELPSERFVHILKTAVRDATGKVIGVQGISWDVTARKLAEEERRKAEAALRESEALYHSLVESLPCSVFRKDLEGRFTFANQRFCELVGRPLEQLLGKTDFDINPSDLAEKYRRDDRKVIETGGVFEDIEEHLSVEARGERYVHTLKTAVRDAAGKVIGMQGICWDVTARKRAEEALAHERYLLHTLMDHLPDAIYFKDAAGRFLRVNKAVADLLGLDDPAQAAGKTHFDFFPEENARATQADDQELMRTGRPLVGEDEPITWPDGRQGWLSTTKLPFRDRDGNAIGVFGVSRDITGRKQAELALRQSEQRYRSVIAAMQDGIVLLDADGGIRECNGAAERILGLSAEQLTGRTPHDPRWRAVHEDGAPFPGETHPPMVTLRTGRPCTDVVMGVHKPDGTLTWITVNAQPLFQADGRTLAGVVASFEDITDRKRTEEARTELLRQLATAQEDERRRLARELHDRVGQQLTSLILTLKAGRDGGQVAAPGRELLERLQRTAEEVGRELRDLALRPTALDDLGLPAALQSAVEEWSRRAGVEADFHTAGLEGRRLPGQVETALYRVVLEVLSNVLKHARARHVSVLLERRDNHAVAIVEDDGAGFDTEAALARPPAGRLGLLSMRERLALVGGTLEVESAPGAGTTVFARVPLPAAGEGGPP
jgi:PAS domain S-box-containing protein